MSRSRKKTPIMGITGDSSEAWDKRRWNKALRAASRDRLKTCKDFEELLIPDINEVSNQYDGNKDGFRYFDPKKHPEWLRK